MANTVDKVITAATNEVGYLEKETNSNLNSKTANAGDENYTKYGKWLGLNGQFWCAAFISWIFYTAYGTTVAKKLLCGAFSGACETIRSNFDKKGQYFKRGDKKPKKGDLIFFTGTRHSGANHIGIVYKVDSKKVYTIEGNTSGGSAVVDNGGGVAKKSYLLTNTRIMGYGRPEYETEPVSTYYNKYTGTSSSIVDGLIAVGEKDYSLPRRKKIAVANNVSTSSTVAMNTKLLLLLKDGKLKKA